MLGRTIRSGYKIARTIPRKRFLQDPSSQRTVINNPPSLKVRIDCPKNLSRDPKFDSRSCETRWQIQSKSTLIVTGLLATTLGASTQISSCESRPNNPVSATLNQNEKISEDLINEILVAVKQSGIPEIIGNNSTALLISLLATFCSESFLRPIENLKTLLQNKTPFNKALLHIFSSPQIAFRGSLDAGSMRKIIQRIIKGYTLAYSKQVGLEKISASALSAALESSLTQWLEWAGRAGNLQNKSPMSVLKNAYSQNPSLFSFLKQTNQGLLPVALTIFIFNLAWQYQNPSNTREALSAGFFAGVASGPFDSLATKIIAGSYQFSPKSELWALFTRGLKMGFGGPFILLVMEANKMFTDNRSLQDRTNLSYLATRISQNLDHTLDQVGPF